MTEVAIRAGVEIGFGLDHVEVHYSFSVLPDRPPSDTVVSKVLQAGSDIWGAMDDDQRKAVYAAIQPTIDRIKEHL